MTALDLPRRPAAALSAQEHSRVFPIRPTLTFVGPDAVRANHTSIFDLRARLLDHVVHA
jgi:hypothetical protein